jgi:hypothetical protein
MTWLKSHCKGSSIIIVLNWKGREEWRLEVSVKGVLVVVIVSIVATIDQLICFLNWYTNIHPCTAVVLQYE